MLKRHTNLAVQNLIFVHSLVKFGFCWVCHFIENGLCFTETRKKLFYHYKVLLVRDRRLPIVALRYSHNKSKGR